jgi:hypothetical protein
VGATQNRGGPTNSGLKCTDWQYGTLYRLGICKSRTVGIFHSPLSSFCAKNSDLLQGPVSHGTRADRKTDDVGRDGPVRSTSRAHLLLKVPPILFVDEHQVQIVAGRELLVHVPICRRQFEAAKEETDRDRLACARPTIMSAVHNTWRTARQGARVRGLD